jgi:TolB-like protein/DNA-binding winged helix-turn-helix (wHTH) protein/tetratricopeptide (TPR) repeat protein
MPNSPIDGWWEYSRRRWIHVLRAEIFRSSRRFILVMDNSAEARIFEFGDFHLDAAKRQLAGADGVVEIPSRAFDVLLYMVAHPGELLDKATLLKVVWPTTVVEESNLSQCIFALRRALGDTAAEPRFIATVPGRGYQFVAKVGESPAVVARPADTRLKSRRVLYASAVLALVVALLGAFWFWPASPPARPADVAAAAMPASIAVLPFADLSSTGDMDYFADGIAEELMSSLSKVRGLRIISRHSSFAFKGKSADARSIGEQLGVETILEGAVRKEGDRIRITAQLTRTKDGVSLWAETYDRQFNDVLDIQGSIAREVTATLAPVVQNSQESGQTESPGAILTHDAEAYRAYLRGMYQYNRWTDRWFRDPAPARIEFLRAVELDPQFAKAYAMLARTYQQSAMLEIGNVAQQNSLASDAIDKALELDPAIRDWWWVKAMFDEKNAVPWTVYASHLEQAIATNPTDSEPMLWLAYTYLLLGRRDEALQMFERAFAADPLSPLATDHIAWWGYALRGDRQRLLDLTDQMARMWPNDPKVSWIRSNLALVEGRALDWDRFVARVIEIDPADYQNHAWLSYDYARVAVFDAARYHARVCTKLHPEGAACAYSIARTEMLSGDITAARKTVLEAMTRNPQSSMIQLAQGELQYFIGDCAGALRSIAQARPEFARTEVALDLRYHEDGVAIFAWCLRKQGEAARAAALNRMFIAQHAPPVTAGLFEHRRARMAAAMGDRDALVAHLTALANTRSPDDSFVRHEPMIQAYLMDAEVVTLLDKLDARRAEWRRILPKASMRVPVPDAPGAAGS